MELADYRAGDELELCAWLGGRTVAEAAVVERLTPDLWRWRFGRRAAEPGARVVVARREGQLLGYAASVPITLRVRGAVLRAVQVHFDAGPADVAHALHGAILEGLAAAGVQVVFGLVQAEHEELYRAFSFAPLFAVHARNLYLGLSGVSRRLDRRALQPFRRFAEKAVSLRPKLVEQRLDDASLEQAARMFAGEHHEEAPDLSVERDLEWLRWRYAARPGGDFRLLELRRKAGAGLDAVVIVRLFEYEPGRKFIQLMDHATREGRRRSTAWLLGEIAMWGLAERADVLQAFAASGSELDQALIGSGCIRKKRLRTLWARWLGAGDSPLPAPFPPRHVELCAGAVEL